MTNVSKNRVSQLDRRLQVLEMEREHDLAAWQLEREQLVQVLKHRGQVVEVPSAVDMMGMSMGMGMDGTGETGGLLTSPGGLGEGGVSGHVGGAVDDGDGDGDDGDAASGDGDGGKDAADGDDGARSIASGPAGLHVGGVHAMGPGSVAMSMRDDGVGTGAMSSAVSVDGTEAGGLPPLGLTGRRRRYGAAEARRRRWQTVARSTQTRRYGVGEPRWCVTRRAQCVLVPALTVLLRCCQQGREIVAQDANHSALDYSRRQRADGPVIRAVRTSYTQFHAERPHPDVSRGSCSQVYPHCRARVCGATVPQRLRLWLRR